MNNLIYIMAANLIVWVGIFVVIMRIDMRLKKLEK
ncbi:MAG: CcmD family protein [candidate division Zixibacteria bacterium]|jgi:CcmD family protein|nr:CcmD family protein [candidate division Zixibacteria bacterium]